MKVEIVEPEKRVVVSGYFKDSLLTPHDMEKIFKNCDNPKDFIISQLDFISFYKNKKITFLNLGKSFDTVAEVSAEIDKLGFKFAPFFEVFTINFMNPGFQKSYPNLTAVQSKASLDYFYLAFNFLKLGYGIGFTREIIFDKSLWYACIPK